MPKGYMKIIFLLMSLILMVSTEDASEEINKELVARGEVQSCRGCSLNRLPDVKNFIYGDLPKFSGVDFHPIPGAIPELVLFDKADKELQRIDLSSLSRDKCNELVGKWFKLKDSGSASYEIREDL